MTYSSEVNKISPISIPIAIKNSILDLILDELLKGTECPNPKLNIYTAGGSDTGTLLVSFNLNNPPFERANNGRAKIYEVPTTIAINSGEAKEAIFYNKNQDKIFSCTVGSITDTSSNLIVYQSGVPEQGSAIIKAGYSVILNTTYITINERFRLL
ncbi:hypothetical protein V6O07_04655 [Arthrospira platensis SPKY2]